METQENNKNKTPIKLGITHGDINGIGYEIIMKALSDSRILDFFTPVVYGSSKVTSYYRKTLNLPDFNFNIIKSANKAQTNKPNLVNIYNHEIKIELGHCTEAAGNIAYIALESAVEDLKNGTIDALVTAPINKQNIQSNKFNFPGHTEYLAGKFNVDNHLMLMISQNFRIGVITGHVPLKDVPSIITEDLILQKIRVLNNTLIKDFSIRKPRIAILGLNPHAGDKGVIGKEDEQIVIPAIKKAFDEGILSFGPYPADGFFGSTAFQNFDGILAMYHDQGLIPFKALSFKSGVNYTAGLPVIRTSPAHGTAYDIAGKNIASPDAIRQAMYLAVDIYHNRKTYQEITANPLKVSALEEDTDSDNNVLDDLDANGYNDEKPI